MAETKGLVIEIGADTSKFNKSLRAVQSPLKKVQSELKHLDKALKLDPKNVTLLKQKMDLMKRAVTEADAKVGKLKEALNQAKVSGAPAEQIRRLERELASAEVEAKGLRKELALFKASQSTIGRLGTSFKSMGDKLSSAGNSVRGFSMAAGAATAALGGLAYKTAQYVDDINTLSTKTGVATGTLQKFGAISELVDTDLSSLATGQGKIVSAMRSGSDAFDKYGVKIKNTDGSMRNSEDVFMDYIRAVGNLSSKTDQAAAMQEMFGTRAYQALMPLMANIDSFDEMNGKLDKMGLALDQKALDRMNEFNDQIDWLKAVGTLAFYKVGSAIGKAIGPNLEGVAQKLSDFANYISGISPRVTKLAMAFGGISAAAAPVLIIAGKLTSAFGSIFTAISKVGACGGVIGKLATNLGRFAGPVGIAVTAFIALYKNSESFRTAINQLVGVLGGTFKQVFTALQPVLSTVGSIIATLAGILGSILGTAIKALMPIITLLASAFSTMVGKVSTIMSKFLGVISKVISSVKKHLSFSGIVGKVAGVFSSIKTKMTSPFTKARDTIKGVVNKIKGFFPFKIGKIFSSLKIPKISVKGGKAPFGIGGKGSLPKFSVAWAAKGGIVDGATLIGAGEKGKEAIVPLAGREMAPFAKAVAENFNSAPGASIDYDRLAGSIVKALSSMDSTTVVQIDGKTLAKTTAPYMQKEQDILKQRANRKLGFAY